MKKDYIMMILIIAGIVLSLLVFVSKDNIKKALFAVLVAQLLTWPLGLYFVSSGKIEYPVRFFPKSIDSSFLHGYIMNPSIYAIYYLHYPRKCKLIWRVVYTMLIASIPAFIEVLENRYTNLLKYKNWNGFYSWILVIVACFIMNKYADWFYKNITRGVIRDEV